MQANSLSCITVLKDAFSAVSRGFNWLVKTFWVVVLVYWVSQLVYPRMPASSTAWQVLTSMLITLLATLMTMRIAKALLENEALSIGEIVSFSLKKYGRGLLLSLFMWVVSAIISYVTFVLVPRSLLKLIPVASKPLVGLAIFLLMLVGLFVALRLFALAGFAFLLEDRGLIEAFKESWGITGEYFWSFLCLLVLISVLGIIGFIVAALVSIPFALLGRPMIILVLSFVMTCLGILFTTALYLFYGRAVGMEVSQVMGEDE